jgi:hypothetical protein
MNRALPFTAYIPELKINILAALWRAYPAPLGLSELYVNCDCAGLMTAYFLALADMELAGWVRDASFAPFTAELTREGVALIFSLRATRPEKFPIAGANQLEIVRSDGQRSGDAAESPMEVGGRWTAAHEHVFGIKPAPCGDPATSEYREPAAGTGIHLIATGRQQLLKTPEEAGEPCITCQTRTQSKCGHCDAPICRAHGYSADSNEPGELCGECRDAARVEIEGIRTHGRADLGVRK